MTLRSHPDRRSATGRNAIFVSPLWTPGTSVGKALAKLTHATDIAKIEKLATLTELERTRLARLAEDLSKDPATAAAEQQLRAGRVKRLFETLDVIAACTGDEAVAALIALHKDAATKRDAARLAAESLFGGDCLPNVGGEVWRTLWDAARRYSIEVAYPTAPFPPMQPDTLCVLCHQPLSAEAVQRMRRFETFVRDDTERQARQAEGDLSAAVHALKGLAIHLRPVADSLREVELHDKAVGKTIRRALATARVRRHAVLRQLAGDESVIVPAASPFPMIELETLGSDVRKYAAQLQNAATGDDRRRLEAERQELADRAALTMQLDTVKAEIGRLQAIRFLETCIADTATNSITTLGNKIADQVLTPRLRDRFAAELIALVGANVRVEMVRAGGQYGSPQYQVRLLARPDAKVAEVLSEGEQTCVAIAAFLAELATAPHSSALVFDDPITSLDHKWRHKVAKRLVAEAAVITSRGVV